MYNSGRYIYSSEMPLTSARRRLADYLCGVTISRHRINRLKPRLLSELEGTVLDIGSSDNELKAKYTNGLYVTLDLRPGPGVDVVANAECMPEIASQSLGGVF